MSIEKLMLKTAIARALLRGRVTIGASTYPCSHSPIMTQQLLSADGGGFSPTAVVTIIIDADAAAPGTIRVNRSASLVAADGVTYPLQVISHESEGNPYFTQLTCHHANQGA